MFEVFLAALVGAFISLDRTAFLQIMVSQPLVAGTLVGFLLGDPLTGLTIGSILELLWIGDVPMGSSVPPNETAAAVIATSISILTSRDTLAAQPSPIQIMVFSVLLSIPLAVLCQKVDIYVRSYNRRFVLNAERLLESRDFLRIGRENLKGLISFFFASFFSIFLLLGVGLYMTKVVYFLIPEPFLKGLFIAFCLLISLGTAVSIRTARVKRGAPVLFAGFLMGMVFMYFKD